jgi:hypothetical protein
MRQILIIVNPLWRDIGVPHGMMLFPTLVGAAIPTAAILTELAYKQDHKAVIYRLFYVFHVLFTYIIIRWGAAHSTGQKLLNFCSIQGK